MLAIGSTHVRRLAEAGAFLGGLIRHRWGLRDYLISEEALDRYIRGAQISAEEAKVRPPRVPLPPRLPGNKIVDNGDHR